MQQFIVEVENERIDTYLAKKLDKSRSKIGKFIEDNVSVNDKKVKNSYIVKLNDIIKVNDYVEEEIEALPEKMDLDIIYEDEDVIVVNKPNGLVVHPAIGNTKHTLVNGLIYHSDSLSNINGTFRPGIVHRIDAYTTGLLMVAKNDKTHDFLSRQLSEQKANRKYIALVWGIIKPDTITIDAPIGRSLKDRKKMDVVSSGKEAITHLKVLERYKNTTLVELTLETGRTHQIRVHLNYIGYPIVNDPVYGRRKIIDDTGQCLHAYKLGFIHPKTGKYLDFTCKLPECFNNILNKFKEEL